MPVVYILRSQRDGRWYVGSATIFDARLRQHRRGHTHTTARFGGFDVALVQEFPTIAMARSAERRLKKMKRHDYIARMVADGYIRLST